VTGDAAQRSGSPTADRDRAVCGFRTGAPNRTASIKVGRRSFGFNPSGCGAAHNIAPTRRRNRNECSVLEAARTRGRLLMLAKGRGLLGIRTKDGKDVG